MLFDPALIPSHVGNKIQAGYKLRPLDAGDFSRGVLDVLRGLTVVGDISKEQFIEQFQFWQAHPETYFVVVVQNDQNEVVAIGTLFIERKLIHELGKVGHIEDIAVRKDQQGLKLGKHLVSVLTEIASSQGCYKIILNCDPKNIGFYQKCGYSKDGIEMTLRL